MPKGFLFNALASGIKKEGLDLGLVVSEYQAVSAGVFTTNLVQAAPVLLGKENLIHSQARAILVNSGCANACTGEAGLQDVREILEACARLLGLSAREILPASTGVIGERLPVSRILAALPDLVQGLSQDKADLLAQAMMTTDTFPKLASRVLSFQGKEVRLLGLAKGAGMIAPNMATMLSFLFTDASLSPDELSRLLRQGVSVSFNRITVDGDTSTNDTVYALANGASGIEAAQIGEEFVAAFEDLCRELAFLIVKDGEGATKVVTIRVVEARDEGEALLLARTVADSLLVKTAFFGEDPNWGRILAAMGRSGVFFDPYQVDLSFDQVMLVQNGLSLGQEAEKAAHKIMKNPHFTLTIRLKQGKAFAEVITCDLSYDYVKINAEYRT